MKITVIPVLIFDKPKPLSSKNHVVIVPFHRRYHLLNHLLLSHYSAQYKRTMPAQTTPLAEIRRNLQAPTYLPTEIPVK